ncbi:MAG: alpha-glucosidase [Halalkalicoccus sp.]
MADTTEGPERTWWKEAVVYQIYPKSFNDSDGDGVGDIPGIAEKVEYLDWLGVDVVWLNPVYASPMADNGYDIADYRAIHPAFGTMDDWEELLEKLHRRNIRLIMDLVVNHTSDEHEWFVRSKAGDSEYEEYYFWREGSPDEPPNNWTSFFGGPAWSRDDERGAWYLHLFDEKQPDLNWEHPEVRADVFEMMNWWFEKGIDGFRMDVIDLVSKPEGLLDGDPKSEPVGEEHFVAGPQLEEYLEEMDGEVLSNYDAMTVGESVGANPESAHRLVGDGPLDMLIHFEHMSVDVGGSKWDRIDLDLPAFKSVFDRWQTALYREGWNCLYLENHDQPRSVSRFGDDAEYRVESAKLLGTLLCTLRGSPFIYQGQEIGMTNTSFTSASEVRDVWAENFLAEHESFEEARPALEACSRDNARTPMQWNSEKNAGFSDGEPWIGVDESYTEINVERARSDPDSVLHYYRELIEIRSGNDVLVYGEYEDLLPEHERLWAYTRTLDDDRALVLLNVSAERGRFEAGEGYEGATLLLGNYPDPGVPGSALRPYEARVYEL